MVNVRGCPKGQGDGDPVTGDIASPQAALVDSCQLCRQLIRRGQVRLRTGGQGTCLLCPAFAIMFESFRNDGWRNPRSHRSRTTRRVLLWLLLAVLLIGVIVVVLVIANSAHR